MKQLQISLAFVALALAGCHASPAVERARGASQAIVRGTVQGRAAAPTSTTVALVWTYWNPEDCETSVDSDGHPSSACSGSTLATTATIEGGTDGFTLRVTEPPPSFVHGFDTEVAEAVIALLPEGDLSTYGVRSGVPELPGFSRDHLVVYVPRDLPAERIEAQELGGAALGQGFHLVRAIADGPQVEGTSPTCPSGDACVTITSQRGERTSMDEEVVIEVGADSAEMPALFL